MKCKSHLKCVVLNFFNIGFHNFRPPVEISSGNDFDLSNQQIGATREQEAVEIEQETNDSLWENNSSNSVEVNQQTPNGM